MTFSITLPPKKVMMAMAMDNMIMNRFWSGGNGKIQPKRDFCKVVIITFGGCCCCCYLPS
jgi:hypothetical protein